MSTLDNRSCSRAAMLDSPVCHDAFAMLRRVYIGREEDNHIKIVGFHLVPSTRKMTPSIPRPQPKCFVWSLSDHGQINKTEPSVDEIISRRERERLSGNFSGNIILVQNINEEWMNALRSCYEVDLKFFERHSESPETRFLSSAASSLDLTTIVVHDSATGARYWNLGGAYVRETQVHGKRKITPTRISCWKRLGGRLPALYLFLTNTEPTRKADTKSQQGALVQLSWPVRLHFHVSHGRDGLRLPGSFDPERLGTHFDFCFREFFSRKWHFDLFFDCHWYQDDVMSPEALIYLLVASMWQSNETFLREKIKYYAFRMLRTPHISINDKLHDLREALDRLQTEVAGIQNAIPHDVKCQFQTRVARIRIPCRPDMRLADIETRAKDLSKFLMDTFSILLASTAVHQADVNNQQADRTEKLTFLALIYVPISFATGVFGMNVKEINNSPRPIWVVAVSAVLLVILTTYAYFIYMRLDLGWQEFKKRVRNMGRRNPDVGIRKEVA